MKQITLTDKLKLFIQSSKHWRGIFLLLTLFLLIGALLTALALHFKETGLVFIGGAFVVLPLFTILYTMPSSMRYGYEKALIDRYGKYANARVTQKEILDYSHRENRGKNCNPWHLCGPLS